MATQQSDKNIFAPRQNRWRIRIMAYCFLFGFILILGRLFYVQIIKGSEYREKAARQYEAKVELRPQRGIIYDRAGRVIATTIQSASYAVDPKMIQDKVHVCQLVARACDMNPSDLLQKIAANKSKNFVWLSRGLRVHEVAELDSLRDPGFIRLAEPRRNYVYGAMAAQLIGCTDVDNRGLSGIELSFDSLLHGASGFASMHRDGRGHMRPSVNNVITPVKDGNSVQLTIDAEVQSIVEYELRQGIDRSGAVSGTVVALDPRSGEILALASYPTFNPNNLSISSTDVMRLRGISDMYEPGSTFKLVTTAALLEEAIVTPNGLVDGLQGTLTLPDGAVIRDHEPLGKVSLRTALEKSSNIVFANLAKKIPKNTFYRYTRDFGFGIPTGIDIPGEAVGLLKKPSNYDNTTQMFMAFGYELAATALQVANSYATIANGGQMMKPYVVKALLDNHGTSISEFEPQKIRRVVSATTARTLTDMLVGVVENGTGKEARVLGLRIAGKTGTAQQIVDGKYSKQAYTASFAGYFPAEDPQVVIVVMLDRPQTDIYGGRTAAPIFRNIVRRIIMSPQLVSTMPTLTALGAQVVRSDSITLPDVRGLSYENAQPILREVGVRTETNRSDGIIATQSPKAGTILLRGSAVKLTLRERLISAATSKESGAKEPRNSPSSAALPLKTVAQKSLDVRGMTLRRAITILHAEQVKVVVRGSGKVASQQWRTIGKQRECILTCE